MLTKKKIITSVLLIFAILLLVNLLASKFFVRLDFTADKEFTLSDATENILNNLNGPVTITAYFSQNLPPNIAQVRADFKDMLIEYNNSSGGKILYNFVDPNKDQQTEMDAQRAGIRPIMINVRERDQMKQQRAYMGAVLKYGGKKDVIPFIQPGAAMEYALSSTLKKLSLKHKTKIAFLSGNGETPLSSMQQLQEQLSIMYDVQSLNLNDTTNIPPDIKTIAVIAPKDTLPPLEINKIDKFLSNGGRVLVALNRVSGNLQNASGSSVYTGLSTWLNKKGIDVQDQFIVDQNCGNVMVRQQQGMFVMNTPVKFPYLPVITHFADHPITKGLESVILPFASPIKVMEKDSSLHVVNLAVTSSKTGLKKPPINFDISKQWNDSDYPLSSVPVGVAVDGKFNGNTYSKLVVFGDGDFVENGSGKSARKLEADNVSLMANSIDWLSDDTGLISLRTKGITSRPLNADLESSTKTLIKYLNFLLPILLIILYGVIRYRIRRRQRNKWMSEDYAG